MTINLQPLPLTFTYLYLFLGGNSIWMTQWNTESTLHGWSPFHVRTDLTADRCHHGRVDTGNIHHRRSGSPLQYAI